MSCEKKLKEKGLKLTPQRKLILDVIHDASEHLTGEEIVNTVQSRMPGVHKSTIYRTLDLLANLGSVYKSELDDKFIYHHAEEGHHHHLICLSCGKTIDCNENLFVPVERTLAQKYGFHVDFKHVVMNGLCRECQSKTGKKTDQEK